MSPEVNPAQEKKYSCWGVGTCTLKIKDVIKDFKEEFKGWLEKKVDDPMMPRPIIKDQSADPEGLPEEDNIVLINQALVLLGLIKPNDLKTWYKMKLWGTWGEATVKGLKEFQKITNIPAGQKRSGGQLVDAAGEVFGGRMAKTMLYALQVMQKGGDWKTAVKSYDPDAKKA